MAEQESKQKSDGPRKPGTFKPGQSGNPAGRPPDLVGQGRSPVFRAMRRIMSGKAPRGGEDSLEAKVKKWYDDDFPGFAKEYARLEVAGKPAAAEPAEQEEPDPGAMRARALIKELLEKFYQQHPEVKRPSS